MNVLLAIDDDPVQADAIEVVRTWLPDDARIVALHVAPTPGLEPTTWVPVVGGALGGYPFLTPAAWPVQDEVDRHAREVAGRAAAPVGGQPRVEVGNPATTIIDVAEEIEADLIVVGTGDRSWWSTLMEPSVGNIVAREAPCSVLLVRSPGDRDGQARTDR